MGGALLGPVGVRLQRDNSHQSDKSLDSSRKNKKELLIKVF